MAGETRVTWQDRAHFFRVASQMMRRILVDHARARRAQKRPQAQLKVLLDEQVAAPAPPEVDLLALDEALSELTTVDPRLAQVTELRYFGGLSELEVARVLSLSRATVTRDWQTARAWLYRRLTIGRNETSART
jgi:RNA polymerase sigma factor (TIGR02999 family)